MDKILFVLIATLAAIALHITFAEDIELCFDKKDAQNFRQGDCTSEKAVVCGDGAEVDPKSGGCACKESAAILDANNACKIWCPYPSIWDDYATECVIAECSYPKMYYVLDGTVGCDPEYAGAYCDLGKWMKVERGTLSCEIDDKIPPKNEIGLTQHLTLGPFKEYRWTIDNSDPKGITDLCPVGHWQQGDECFSPCDTSSGQDTYKHTLYRAADKYFTCKAGSACSNIDEYKRVDSNSFQANVYCAVQSKIRDACTNAIRRLTDKGFYECWHK